MLVFHPDIPSGISGPWIEIYSLGDINLSPKREHLEALLEPKTKLESFILLFPRKNAVAFTTYSKVHDDLLSDSELSNLVHPPLRNDSWATG